MTPRAIPFERQLRLTNSRPCGAAALAMVYRSLGLVQDQSQVWSRIAQTDSDGVRVARTHRLAKDALAQGFEALVVQAAKPWQTLQRSAAQSIRTILSLRLNADSLRGHFVVLLDVDDNRATLHDPQLGPARHVDRGQLLSLWSPTDGRSEIVGHVFVAVAERSDSSCQTNSSSPGCPQCGLRPPTSVPCPACDLAIRPQPAAVLGCSDPTCSGRLWKTIFCPGCDRRLSEL